MVPWAHRVHNLSGIAMHSAVFVGFTKCDRQTTLLHL